MFGKLSRTFVSPLSRTSRRKASYWNHVVMGPKDPILGVSEAFNADKSSKKLNLGVGAYRDDNGKPFILPSVKEAEKRFMSEPNYNHEYFPIGGSSKFCELSKKLAFGDNVKDADAIVAIQGLSGTGSLRILAQFIQNHWPKKELPTVYVPNPTWGNHNQIFGHSGLKVQQYSYYDPSTCGLDFEGLKKDLQNVSQNSVVLLHASAHNPTGVDPNEEQWKELCSILKKKECLVFFDMAYQGFASGDCDRDAFAVRHFQNEGIKLMLAQSYAKNFGIYGQRAGVAYIVCNDKQEKEKVESQIKIVARGMYSNPPLHGARIVETILNDPKLKQQWLQDVKLMADRIIKMRQLLTNNLVDLGSTRNWNHIEEQIGMFCFSGLTPEQVDKLKDDYHIYMTRNGRISMAGVTSGNVRYLAESIHEITK